jgi:hypothetical protein
MRIQNEQSGSTSLFAHPMAIEAIPETPGLEAVPEETISSRAEAPLDSIGLTRGLKPPSPSVEAEEPIKLARGTLEARMEAALAVLAAPSQTLSPTLRQGHLALLKRWYYRPEARRSGEIFFPDDNGRWPVKAMLRGVGRVVGKTLVGVRDLPPSPR